MADIKPIFKFLDAWVKKTAYQVQNSKWVLISSAESEQENQPYLTFSSAEAFTVKTRNTTKNWDGTIEYSTDTETWSEWDGTAEVASAEHDGEQRIYMRGSGNSIIAGDPTGTYTKKYKGFLFSGNGISCSGNIENLLDYQTVANGEHPTMANKCFAYMFRNCTNLITAPELSSVTLSQYCYSYMFYGCTSLTAIPELPAVTLEQYCYYNMFYGCTGLITAPIELPATTLAICCYSYMFKGCTSLISAPKISATTLATSCCAVMFADCTSLVEAPELPATTLAKKCYMEMFDQCTSLVTLPKLSATTLAEMCYDLMFYGCTSIKLSETQTDEYPNEYRIPTSGTGTTADNALLSMFTGTGGTFTGTPEINTTYYTSNEVI